MIWTIDTSKIPDKNTAFCAEVILTSYKLNQTIDESIEEMKNVLKNKKGE
jgi:hypothetical protein